MGKGARIREEKRREAALEGNVQALLSAMDDVEGPDDLAALVESHPELFGAEVLGHIESVGEISAAAAYIDPIRKLVRLADEDPKLAWETYKAGFVAVEESVKSLERSQRRWVSCLKKALRRGRRARGRSCSRGLWMPAWDCCRSDP